ncbi:AAA family ATPase [Mucilaginibacter terrae]|uniref:Transitional endoplasmic reticulum ATPase n=1 Tax=Mucilaginibacter terrae TaxID=1955052 RepID=A0ABU3GR98_9SPHI|nr:AAA family ATPase [Mucilaginibacter terrae]MDT3401482.1 transitional endoplasmic reticulum ATPase [Mucilaginibacter terrae]
MNRELLTELEKALEITPDNIILRKQVAKGYFAINDFERAKEHLNLVLNYEPTDENKLLLAKCYLKLKHYTPGIIICEELLPNNDNAELLTVYLQLLIDSGHTEDAIAQYQAFMVKYPNWHDTDIERQLKIPSFEMPDDDDYNAFIEKPDINFSHIGGMDEIKDDIRIKIIEPLANPELFKAFGKKAGGGILMYGPPGCGKTYLSRATAGEISSKFMNIGIEEVLDMWVGNSEKNLHEKFEIARQNNPCVMFFDEIDALGSKRSDLRQSAGRNLINQFLQEMDGIDSKNEGVLILGATNSPWHIDSAFLRPGRFDRIIFVPPPDLSARTSIVEMMLRDKPAESMDYGKIASKTDGFSGADLKLLIDLATEEKLRQSMRSGKIEKITQSDVLNAVKKVRPSTKEWFNTARNYALYSNTSGMYDDIKAYLNL